MLCKVQGTEEYSHFSNRLFLNRCGHLQTIAANVMDILLKLFSICNYVA